MARRLVRWIVAVLAVVPVAAACGGGTTGGTAGSSTNGLEGKTPAQVQQAAMDAFKSAGSVHVTGKATDGSGKPVEVDFRIQGTSTVGSMVNSGARVDVTVIGDTTYLKADQAGWQALTDDPAAGAVLAGKWVKMPPDKPGQENPFTAAAITDDMTKNVGGLRPGVEQTTFNGTQVVVITDENGDKLYVANTGEPRPLRFSSVTNGDIDLTEYGTDFHITAPPDAIDLAAQP
jgi:hypothetical protein